MVQLAYLPSMEVFFFFDTETEQQLRILWNRKIKCFYVIVKQMIYNDLWRTRELERPLTSRFFE